MKKVFFGALLTVSVTISSASNDQIPLLRTQSDQAAYDIAYNHVYYNSSDYVNFLVSSHTANVGSAAENGYHALVKRPSANVAPIESRFKYWWSTLNGDEITYLDYALRRKYSPAETQRIIDETYRNRVMGLIKAIESGVAVCSASSLQLGFNNGNYVFPIVPNFFGVHKLYGQEQVPDLMYNGKRLSTNVPSNLISEPEYSKINKLINMRDGDNALINGVKTCWKPLGYIITHEANPAVSYSGGAPSIPNPIAITSFEAGELVGNVEVINFKTGKTLYVFPKNWFN